MSIWGFHEIERAFIVVRLFCVMIVILMNFKGGNIVERFLNELSKLCRFEADEVMRWWCETCRLLENFMNMELCRNVGIHIMDFMEDFRNFWCAPEALIKLCECSIVEILLFKRNKFWKVFLIFVYIHFLCEYVWMFEFCLRKYYIYRIKNKDQIFQNIWISRIRYKKRSFYFKKKYYENY